MSHKDTPKTINNSVNYLSKLIESDTQVSIIDLNLLENLNTNQSLNYIKLEQSLNNIEKNHNILKNINEEFQRYQQIIGELDMKSIKLEGIVNELDQWSKDLEIRKKERS